MRCRFHLLLVCVLAAPALSGWAREPGDAAAPDPSRSDCVGECGDLPAPPSPGARASPAQLLSDARFRRTWRSVLGAHGREPWLAQMNGPAAEPRWVVLGGKRYVLHAFCKPHDCYDNNAVLLYSPTDLRIHAWVHRGQGAMLVGNPSPPIATELQRLWRSEWRAQSR